jgi:hypothetical protein
MAEFYDVIVGLHPDEALPEVVASAHARPVVVVPCCNFWDRTERLGRDALLARIAADHVARRPGGTAEAVTFAFRGPKNEGLVLLPPART